MSRTFATSTSSSSLHYDVSVGFLCQERRPPAAAFARASSARTPLRFVTSRASIRSSSTAIGDWRDTFDVQIPCRLYRRRAPRPVNVDAGFASYHSEVKTEGQTLRYSREYIVKKLDIDAGQYAALCKFEAEINTDENRSAVLKKQ